MPDILLVQPPIRDFYLTQKRTLPYGLAGIAAMLAKDGFSVEILDCPATPKSRIIDLPECMAYLEPYFGKADMSPFSLFHRFRHFGYSFEHIRKTAQESGAFLVGISSLFTAYCDEAMQTAEIIKSVCPDCRIVLGGHHPTAMPEAVMASPAVDFVIRGEGEIAMTMLARDVRDNSLPESVPGIVYRKTNGTLHINPPAVVDNLDALPLPAMAHVKQSFYARNKKGSTVIMASRGCPMSCSYCSVGGQGPPYRKRSVASVMKEIEAAVTSHDAGFIDFEDENLSLDKAWFLELLHSIDQKFKDRHLELRAMNGLYPPSLDETVIQAMAKAGFRTLNLSLGSTSKSQLKRFRRHDVTGAVEQCISHAARSGLNCVCYVIAGAPGQSARSSVDDLLFLAHRKTLAGVSIFYPSPGSMDFRFCAEHGLLPASFSLMRSTAFPISHTTQRVESVTLMRLGRILNFIKSLREKSMPLPAPAPFSHSRLTGTRENIGIILLSGFFHDYKIRGVERDGSVYEHVISTDVTQRFVEGLGLAQK